MMSAKILDFFTPGPLPPWPHLDLIHTKTQPPSLPPLFHEPPPPPMQTSYLEAPFHFINKH